MANVLSITYFVLGCVIAHSSLLLWVMTLPADWIDSAVQRIEKSPFRAFLSGIAMTIVCAIMCCGLLLIRQSAFGRVSDGLGWLFTGLSLKRIDHDASMITHAIGWFLLTPFFAAFLLGEAAMVERFACRLSERWEIKTLWWSRVAGAFSLSFGYFTPIVGWFLFFPIIALLSLGSGAATLMCCTKVVSSSPLLPKKANHL